MPGSRIGDAPSGEDSSIDGTEKLPVTGSKWTTPARIADYIRTLVQTLTNKTIDLASNTLTGTKAQFNTAMSDADFATLTGSETLTNKTLTAPTLADFTNAAHDHGDADDGGSLVASITLTTPTIADFTNAAHDHGDADDGGSLAASITLTTPTIASFTNAQHDHEDADDGGTLDEDALAFTDVTTNNSSTAKHGLLKKLDNTATHYMDGTGAWTTPGGAFMLNVNTTPVGNVGSGEDNLISYDVPANTLDTNGQQIHYIMGGTYAASINTKRIRIKLGSTTLFDTGALAITAAGDWHVEGYIIRTGSATQRCIVEFASNEAALLATADYVDATEDLTTQLTLKATGEATDNDDIIQKLLIAEKGGGAASGGGAIATDTLWDAKGDLAGGTGANTAARLAVGTNGYVLTADSGETTGLKWAVGGGTLLKSFWNPDAPPASPTTEDDEFDNGSLDGKWSEFDHGSSLTVTESSTYKHIILSQTTAAGRQNAGIFQALPAGDFTIITKVAPRAAGSSSFHAGLILAEGTTSTSDLYTLAVRPGNGSLAMVHETHTAYDAAPTSGWSVSPSHNIGQSVYLRIRRNGSNYRHDFSTDGWAWQGRNGDFNPGFTPAYFGIFVNNFNTTFTCDASFFFFRYVASDVGFAGQLTGRVSGIYQ